MVQGGDGAYPDLPGAPRSTHRSDRGAGTEAGTGAAEAAEVLVGLRGDRRGGGHRPAAVGGEPEGGIEQQLATHLPRGPNHLVRVSVTVGRVGAHHAAVVAQQRTLHVAGAREVLPEDTRAVA